MNCRDCFNRETQWFIQVDYYCLSFRAPGTGTFAGRRYQAPLIIFFSPDDNASQSPAHAFERAHSPVDDQYVRIGLGGRCEALPTIQEFRLASEDPEQDARLEAECYAEHESVAKMLEVKGFGLRGDEPGGVQINRFLHLQKPEESNEDA